MRARLLAEIRTAGDAVIDAVDENDVRRHIEFLLIAIELEEPSVFGDYVRWRRGHLNAQDIAVTELADTFAALRGAFLGLLSPVAAEAVDLALRAGVEALTAQQDQTGGQGEVSLLCHLYVATAVTGRRDEALAIVREALSGAESPVDIYVDIFESALYEVGRRWQTKGLTIADEHMATVTTQYILAVLHADLPVGASGRGRAFITGVFGEHHVVGTNIVANVLEEDGWEVRSLGTNLPPETIVAAIRQHGADLLAVSVTMSTSVPGAVELIDAVHAGVTNPPRIIVGGAPFREDPQLWRTVGADGFAADARGVAELARTL